MAIVDWIVIVLIVIFVILGLWLGFGKGLRFFTKGIFGFIISVFICYSLGGFVMKLGFVAGWIESFRDLIEAKEGLFYDILIKIRIDIIVYYVVLFIIVQILRIIIVKIISKVFEIKNVFVKFLNKFFGVILFCGVLVVLVMVVFQVIHWIGGSFEETFISYISESKLRIDWFYANNPLTKIVELLFKFEWTREEKVMIPMESCLALINI